MLLECKNCGAPLDVKEAKKRMKCRYCGLTEERENFREIANETPKNFVQPKKWKPPSGVKADSGTELTYDEPANPWVIFPVTIAIAVLCIVVPLGWNSSHWYTKPEALLKASPFGAHADVAKRLGGKVSGTKVEVPLNSDRYRDVEISYPDEDDPTPSGISLELREQQKLDPIAQAALASHLNGGFTQDNWDWGQAHFAVNDSGMFADVQGSTDRDLRKQQVGAMWTLIMGAAFDPSLAPPADVMRTALGGGYPVSDLSKIPATTTLDKAKGLVVANFPGSLIQADTQMRATIALDHPELRSVFLEWFFEPGGMISGANFSGKSNFVAARDRLADCYKPTWGEADVTIENPLTGARTYTFHFANNWIEVTQGVSIHQYGPHNIPVAIDPAAWTTIVSTLNKCR